MVILKNSSIQALVAPTPFKLHNGELKKRVSSRLDQVPAHLRARILRELELA
jgi:hypothetical protein